MTRTAYTKRNGVLEVPAEEAQLLAEQLRSYAAVLATVGFSAECDEVQFSAYALSAYALENPQEAKCQTCGSVGFLPSALGPNRCSFCDGTEGGHPPTMEDIYDQRVVEAVEILRKIEAFDHQKTAQDALRKGDFVSVTNALSKVAETDMQLWVRDAIRILTEETGND